MSRASVANGSARADAWQKLALFRLSAGSGKSSTRRPSSFEDTPPAQAILFDGRFIVRWGVPLAVSFVVAMLGAALLHYSFREQERVVAEATRDLDFLATVVADDIDDHRQDDPAQATADILKRFVPAQALTRGQRILVSDANGAILATLPAATPAKGLLADEIGAGQPLTVFAEKAGVMRLALPDGEEALATVRTLHAPFGQVLVLHRIDDILGDWRSTHLRMAFIFTGAVLTLAALALAYVRQTRRRREADTYCDRMRNRVDMVLTKGRCGLWDWNLAGGRVEWSKSMFDMIGMSPRAEPLTFAEVNDLIHPDDGDLTAIARALASSETAPGDHQFRMRTTSGEWIWLRVKVDLVDMNEQTTHVVGIAIDITDTMALEERTARADMRLRDALETVSEAFVVWDAENRLVMCNSKFQRFHNLPPEAVAIGTPYAKVMEQGTPPLIHSQVSLGERQPLGARTFEAQLADGRWLQINERRTKDGGYVSVGTDITTLKRHEEQLLESERRLMNTVIDLKKSRQKLELQARQMSELADNYLEQKAEAETANRAKSDFLANMGHELRTPLNAILGFSEMMTLEAFGALGSPQYVEYSKHIHASGQHLLAMIADVLEMARLEAGRVRLVKADFVVGDAIAAVVTSFRGAAEQNGVSVSVDGSQTFALHADRNAFEKILTILLANAVKYTAAEGRIDVRCGLDGGFLHLSVQDTGIGMPPDAVARVGKPFEQCGSKMKNGIRGSGLGLAIARSLVELHDGTMRICSEEGIGTTVFIRLPRRKSLPAHQLQAPAAQVRSPVQAVTRPALQALGPAVARLSRSA